MNLRNLATTHRFSRLVLLSCLRFVQYGWPHFSKLLIFRFLSFSLAIYLYLCHPVPTRRNSHLSPSFLFSYHYFSMADVDRDSVFTFQGLLGTESENGLQEFIEAKYLLIFIVLIFISLFHYCPLRRWNRLFCYTSLLPIRGCLR
jgi:hypothetical protein